MCVVLLNRYLNSGAPELGGVICMIYVSGARTYTVPRRRGGAAGWGGAKGVARRMVGRGGGP